MNGKKLYQEKSVNYQICIYDFIVYNVLRFIILRQFSVYLSTQTHRHIQTTETGQS